MKSPGGGVEAPRNPVPAAEPGRTVEFERVGVDRIDEEARTSTPWTFAAIVLGGSVALGSLIYGWIPITFGLGTWAAIGSIAVGTLIGLPLLIPLILIGSRTATNNATASGAHFGVRGRLIGSFIGLAILLVAVAIVIWTGAGATVAVLARLFDTPVNDGTLAIAYAVITLLVVLVAVYGYHLLVRVTTVLMVSGGLLILLMIPAFAGKIDLGYQGGQYMLGSFWKTWLLSTVAVGIAGALQLVTIMGDWTRYISPRRHPASRLVPVALLAIFIGFVVPPSVGAIVATTFADPFTPFPQSLATDSPTWYAVLLLPLALFGGVGFGALSVYGAGLDLDAIVARLTRAQATVIVSVLSAALVFLGSLVWDASESIVAAALILLTISAPWAAIVGIGFLRSRGRYLLDDLQVFNRGERGGAYWFSGGWDWRAALAWVAGSIFGLLAINTTLYKGPLADLADGVDVSFLGSFAIAGILYLVLEAVVPSTSKGVTTNAAFASAAPSASVTAFEGEARPGRGTDDDS